MPRVINPGHLRHRITFLRPPTGRDDYGALPYAWEPFAETRAAIEPLIGRELYAAHTEGTEIEVKIKTRCRLGIDKGMRIQYKNEVYEIISAVNVDEAAVELVCYCKRVV